MSLRTPIRGLRSFCVAAECLSFKQAAKRLYLTPSAVSHQIKDLEQQLGTALFVRQTRSVELTEQGKAFYESIQPLMTGLESAIERFRQGQCSPSVSLTMPEFFASELVMPKLKNWAENNPGINLDIDTVKRSDWTTCKADVSVVLSRHQPTLRQVYPLFPIHYLVACNQEIYHRWQPSGLEALRHVPLIQHQARPHAWQQWAQQAGVSDISEARVMSLDSMFSVARAAQQGLGIALIPMPLSQAWFDDGSLVQLFSQELPTQDKYFLIRHQSAEGRKEVDVLVRWLLSCFQP